MAIKFVGLGPAMLNEIKDICTMYFNYQKHRVYYEVYGEGPCLLLLHGFLESSQIWNRIGPALSEHYQVVVMDFPGHGKSEVLSEVHSMELMAEVVHALLLKLGIPKLSVLGHSMGGYVALAYLEQYPETVSGIILLNSTTENDPKARKENRNRAIRIIQKDKDAFISMAISNLFSERSQKQFSSEITLLKQTARDFPRAGILALIKGMRDRKDRSSVLSHFAGKKLWICGKEDPMLPMEVSETLAERALAQWILLEGSHMSWLENSDEIVKILLLNDIF